jgi:hypothetical protein
VYAAPVSNIINLRKVKQKRAEGRTLCSSGFHKWQTLTQRRFDVKTGKLVSAERCRRCGEERVRLT